MKPTVKFMFMLGPVAAALLWLVLARSFGLWPLGPGEPSPTLGGADTRLQLHLFIGAPPGTSLPLPADDFVRQTIEAKFNVELRITAMPAGADYELKLASLLASNDPPDMWLSYERDGGASYALNNALADMTLFVSPAAMPDYFRYWMTETELRQYQFHNKFVRAPLPYDKKSYRTYYIRKDWLDRLGLAVPSNYDDYVNVLRAFTFGDPDGNGRNDTYGFTAAGAGESITTDWPEYVKNGLLYPDYYADGQLVDMQMDARVGKVVDDILKITQEGLADPDWFLNRNADALEKAVQGKVGVILGDTADFAADANPDSLQSRSRAIDPNANWMPFNPFGDNPLRAAVGPGYPFVFSNEVSGRNPEKLKRIAAILDWLCGPEGYLLSHYGIEGKHYSRDGDTVTLMPEAIAHDIGQKGNFLAIWSFFTPNDPGPLGVKVVDPRQTERDRTIGRILASIPVYESVGTTLTPPFGINAETMRARQNELQVKMMFGDKSGANWPVYRKQILEMYNGSLIFKQYENEIRSAKGLPALP
ncbi:extracellular solute-binding protein [Paenibacillus sp. GCM10027626]|uniref:extracellular solute-binding protein n=1 Tax=Paenibacillus sp. GCM10027626 TaxID=3273411 RepID=UPI00362B936A